ncbi:MAG: hypothetical protein WCL06_16285 [Bacteroidota bacterium]
MDQKDLKRRLVDYCLSYQKKVAENAMTEMNEAYENASEYGSPEDWFDTYKTDMLTKRDAFGQQFQKALEEIKNIERINPNVLYDVVSFGSVVITDTQKLFVCAGVGKIQVDDEMFYAISPSVPIFQALKGMKKGDTFDFRGNKGKILEVF